MYNKCQLVNKGSSAQSKLFPEEKSAQALMMVFSLQVQSLSAQQLCRHLRQLLQPDDQL